MKDFEYDLPRLVHFGKLDEFLVGEFEDMLVEFERAGVSCRCLLVS